MTKKLKKNILLIVVVTILVSLIQLPVFAAGSFSVAVAKPNMNEGETTTLTLTATRCGGKFDISTSDSSVVSITGGTSEWVENGNYSVTLKANKAGTAKITVTATSVADSDTSEDITGSKSVTITVTAPQPPQTNPKPNDNPSVNPGGQTTTPSGENSKSSDATLKSITVGDKTYNNPSTDFTVTVAANVSQIDINAVTNNSKASVTGTGTKALTTGTNAFILKVTAENGQTRNYKVIVRKLSEENTTPNVVEENPPAVTNEPETQNEEPHESLRLKYLLVEDVQLIPEFNSEVIEYTVFVSGKEKLGIVAAANYEDANIEIVGNENLVVGDNEILIRVTRGEESIQYKITATLEEEQIVPVPGTIDTDDSQGGIGTWIREGGWRYIAFAVLAIIVTILGISLWFANTTEKYSTKARRARSRFSDDEFRL